jgi:hypothetical protein
MISREDMIVEESLREFTWAQNNRSTFDSHWEEVARHVQPSFKNTFHTPSFKTPGEKNTQEQIDSTAALALSRFAAIMDSMLTPRNSIWHTLEASDPNLNKSRAVRLWFEDTGRRLFRARYAPTANFSAQNQAVWMSLGSFGNGPMFVDRYHGLDGTVGLRYRALPLGEVYLKENHQGQVDEFIRYFRMTARNAQKLWPGKLPPQITEKLEKHPNTEFQFIHRVYPNADRDPRRMDYGGKKWKSCYISIEGKALIDEGGYNTFPLPCARDEQAPGEMYGRGDQDTQRAEAHRAEARPPHSGPRAVLA